ncbi:putative transmembrane amino acid transporter [Trypanosoma theileri]|uniref:Putative transmembrane amino acid transporter n=1 Tax=Trypanosoma theileri TaxID=67003 RepID=A0A1X0NYI3_9TRYP|nr:putative transmembrane amino acid transporter [Trypanosoma theileri]ORC89220.1 putative transmembrane amino acid transporter [Trypanosoma theileri]
MSHLPQNNPDEYDEKAEATLNAVIADEGTGWSRLHHREMDTSQTGSRERQHRVKEGKAAKIVLENLEEEGDEEEEIVQQECRQKKKNLAQRFLEFLFPPGSMLASAFTLGSSTLGAGILGLPSAFNMTGYILSIMLLVIVTILTIFSLWLLARAAEVSGKRTYEDVIRTLMGRGPDWLLAFFMCGFCVGGGVGYIISIGNLLTPVFDDPSVPEFLRTKTGNRLITSMIWLVFILPLCLPKQIDSLRHTSMLGVTFIFFFVICIVIDSCRYMNKNGFRSDLEMFGVGNGAIEGLSIIMFACLVQINAFEVYFEMSHPSPRRMVRDSAIAMSGCGMLYILAGFFGYMRFGKTVTDSILLMYQPRESILFAIAYVGIVFKICVAFALHQLPMRDGIYHVIGWDVYSMPWWKNALFCTFLSFVLLVIGLFVPNINVVFGLVGALCGGFIGFIFPALLVMYCGRWTFSRVGWLEYFATYFLLISGCVAVVFGTGASIYGVIV